MKASYLVNAIIISNWILLLIFHCTRSVADIDVEETIIDELSCYIWIDFMSIFWIESTNEFRRMPIAKKRVFRFIDIFILVSYLLDGSMDGWMESFNQYNAQHEPLIQWWISADLRTFSYLRRNLKITNRSSKHIANIPIHVFHANRLLKYFNINFDNLRFDDIKIISIVSLPNDNLAWRHFSFKHCV